MYKRAFGALREGKPDEKEEAVMVLEAWRGLEQQSVAAAEPGSAGAADRQAALQAVEKRMPRRVKRKRPILTEDGLEAGMEVRNPLPLAACPGSQIALCSCCPWQMLSKLSLRCVPPAFP